jgi:hypothetical protein
LSVPSGLIVNVAGRRTCDGFGSGLVAVVVWIPLVAVVPGWVAAPVVVVGDVAVDEPDVVPAPRVGGALDE